MTTEISINSITYQEGCSKHWYIVLSPMKTARTLGILCLVLCIAVALLPPGTFSTKPKQDLLRAAILIGVLVISAFCLLYWAYDRDRPAKPRPRRLPMVAVLLPLGLVSCGQTILCSTHGKVVQLETSSLSIVLHGGDRIVAYQAEGLYYPITGQVTYEEYLRTEKQILDTLTVLQHACR